MKRLFLLLLISGCTTVGPDYERPVVELPSQYPNTKEAANPVVAADWWKLYGDATLDELIAASGKNNVDLRLAAARVREAEALAREAGAAFLPEVTGGYSATRNQVSSRVIPAPQPGVPLEQRLDELRARLLGPLRARQRGGAREPAVAPALARCRRAHAFRRHRAGVLRAALARRANGRS
jgi:outer membrane protein TolC